MHTSLDLYFVFFQLANEMDTRGISSSRDQYNWGAYYTSKRRNNNIEMCAKGQSDGKSEKQAELIFLRSISA